MCILSLCSEFGSLLVVSLIDALQHSALDQSRFYPGFGRYDSYEVVDTDIQTRSLFIIKFDKFFLFCVSHLHHKAEIGDIPWHAHHTCQQDHRIGGQVP